MAGNVASSVREVENIVNGSGIEDQNDVSFNVISQQFEMVATLNVSLDEEVCNFIAN